MTQEEKQQLDKRRLECIDFADSIREVIYLIQKYEVNYREEILKLLWSKYDELKQQANEIYMMEFPKI